MENVRKYKANVSDKKNDFFTVHDKIKSETIRIFGKCSDSYKNVLKLGES